MNSGLPLSIYYRTPKKDYTVDELRALVVKQYNRGIRICDIARSLGYTRGHISNIVKMYNNS